MNILVFSWRDPKHPLAGGAEQVMHEHMKGWIAVGHKVTFFSSSVKGLPRREILDNIEIIRDGYQYLGVQLKGCLYYLKNSKNFDLIVDQFHGLPFFSPIFVRKPKLAVIQETASKVWFLNPFPWPLNWIIGSTGFIIEPFVFFFYKNTQFMTGSESAKKDVSRMGIPLKNITVVPHGVILEKSKSKNQKAKIDTVGYLGVLSKDKGIEDALKCFAMLDKLGNFQFWVIGKPETKEYGEKIRKIIKKFDLGKRLKIWGFVSQKKKFELLAKAHILINPSIHEGWGLVNIEANSVGTPVVSYNSAGLVDSVKDGVSGILCEKNNIKNLADNVYKIFTHQKLYNKLKIGAKKWSKNFNWQKSKKLSLDLIERVVDEH